MTTLCWFLFLASKPSDTAHVILLINILLIWWNTNVQQDTEIKWKLHQSSAKLRKTCRIYLCFVSSTRRLTPLLTFKLGYWWNAQKYTEKGRCFVDVLKSTVVSNLIICLIHICWVFFLPF